jgi:predicted permease
MQLVDYDGVRGAQYNSMDTLLRDLRFATRMLAKNPSFAAISILALALGIGANTAIFSVVNAVLIRPLPFEDADRLVLLWGNVRRQAVERRGASFADYLDWREQSKSYESMAAYWDATFTDYTGDEPERLNGETVASAYFPLLGVAPIAGHAFTASDDQPGAPQTALIGHGLWMRRFGGSADAVGKSLRIDRATVTVIGILPEGFRGLTDRAELWMSTGSQVNAEGQRDRGSRWFAAVARLKPGVSIQQAQAEIAGIASGLERAYPATNEKRSVELAWLNREILGDLRLALLVILGAVGLVLLIACANVANLLLAQAERRQKEVSIRLALGASRARLVRQLVTEAVLLSLIGGALGVVFAWWGVDALLAASPVQFPSFAKVRIDLTVAMFAVLASLLTGLLLGVAPAFHAGAGKLYDTLKEASGRSSAGTGRQRFRSALVVAEVALSVVLLIGAGLLIRSFRHVLGVDPGFNPEHLLAMRIGLPRVDQANPAASVTARAILERMASLPSVQSVSIGTDIPLAGDGNATFYSAKGQPPVTAQNRPRAYVHRTAPGFFATLGIALVRGRDFLPTETEGVAIVSENVARRFWPGGDPIGQSIKTGPAESDSPWLTIVGVVAETKYRALPRNPTSDPDLFFPFNRPPRQFAVFLRTAGDPSGLAAAVRNELKQLDRTAVVYNLATLTERAGEQTAQARFTSWLMGIFSAAALLLAVIGIYGVMSYAVTRRTQEIGVRMALGASVGDVLGMVVRQGLAMILVGLAIGLALAVGLTGLISTMLFGVSATDPATYAAVSGVLVVVAVAATYLPARRATRIDPTSALRYE